MDAMRCTNARNLAEIEGAMRTIIRALRRMGNILCREQICGHIARMEEQRKKHQTLLAELELDPDEELIAMLKNNFEQSASKLEQLRGSFNAVSERVSNSIKAPATDPTCCRCYSSSRTKRGQRSVASLSWSSCSSCRRRLGMSRRRSWPTSTSRSCNA